MRLNPLRLFALLLSLVFFSQNSALAIAWLAYGDLRGNIESCGCDPNTDLGGVARLSALLHLERAAQTSLYVFDLGNNFDSKSPNRIKRKYLALALKSMQAQARLVGQAEMELESDILSTDNNFLLSNRKETTEISCQTSIELPEALILGYYFAPQFKDKLKKVDAKLLLSWKNILDKASAKKKILLFSGSKEDLKKIAEAKLFAEIIRASPKTGSSYDPSERKDPLSLALTLESLTTWQVPLAGAGVLRGGRAKEQEARSLGAILKEMSSEKKPSQSLTNESPSLSFSQEVPVTFLTSDYQKESQIDLLLSSYNAELKADFEQSQKERLKAREKSEYVGSNACQSCHPKESMAYMNSKHAKAFATLKKLGKDNNPECVRCHVVGFNEMGYVSEKETPELLGVGCEMCHSPRKTHIQTGARLKNIPDAKQACARCHIHPHSSAFDFATYWPKIKHP